MTSVSTALFKKEKEIALRKLSEVPRRIALAENLKGRTVIVGDIHGCYNEFERLLETIMYQPETDDLVLLGDLVGKGPRSLDVVEKARNLPRCYCLVGNHDWTVLRWAAALESKCSDPPIFQRKGCEHEMLAQTATPEQLQYLKSLPHLIHIPQYKVLCVHAGIDPFTLLNPAQITAEGFPQYPLNTTTFDMMHMRHGDAETKSVTETGNESVGEGTPWAECLPDTCPDMIVFGHDALRKLQDRRKPPKGVARSLGLDTGCCYGNCLTALVLPQNALVSVQSNFCCL